MDAAALQPGRQEKVLAFMAGGRRLAIPAGRVREVMRLPGLTSVPQSAPVLLGLGYLRSEILPVLSVARLTGGEETASRQAILVGGERPVALAIDRLVGLIESGADEQVLALDELLDRTFPARPERAGHVSGRSATSSTERMRQETLGLLAFEVAGQLFALPLDDVEEVIRRPREIARLPHGARAVLGTIEHRDALLPVLSLAALLGLPDEADDTRIVIARIGSARVGLAVRGVRSVLHVEVDRIDTVPTPLIRGDAEAVIRAVCRPRGGGRLVSILSTGHLLSDDVTAAVLKKGAATVAVPAEIAAREERSLLLFDIGDQRFALPLEDVDRVARIPSRLTRIPDAPVSVAGVASIGGNTVLVVDQNIGFGHAPVAGKAARLILVTVDGSMIGLLVQAVASIARVVDGIVPVDISERRVIEHAFVAEDGRSVTLALSARALLSAIEQDLAAHFGRTT